MKLIYRQVQRIFMNKQRYFIENYKITNNDLLKMVQILKIKIKFSIESKSE